MQVSRSGTKQSLKDTFATYERVMNDERSYDQIKGPNRLKMRLDEKIQQYAEKGKALKTKYFKKSDEYTSFMTEPNLAAIKFDNIVTREQAMKPFVKVGEGAPFWKYNVKDEVITASIRSFNFSRNLETSYNTGPDKFEQKQHDYKCNRIARRLETLKKKYEDLHALDQEDRFHMMQAE